MTLALVSVDGSELAFLAFGDAPRGIVAIGANPVGVLAIGGMARGVIAIGAVAVGFIAIGCAALGASAWGVGVMAGGRVRGVGAGIGLDVGVLGFDPELLGDMPAEGQRGGWWARLLLLSVLVAGAVGGVWLAMPDEMPEGSGDSTSE